MLSPCYAIIYHLFIIVLEYSEPTKIMRGTWFKGSSSNENWEPIDEHDAEKIEVGHQGVVRSLVRHTLQAYH